VSARAVTPRLPAGEKMLWQGQPQWQGLALHAFHVRAVALYFVVLLVWRVLQGVIAGDSAWTMTVAAAWLLVPCGAACGILALLAWLSSRTTQYTITNKRVIMQFGMALPITLNLPFSKIGSAALRLYADGSGDIPLATSGKDRVAFLMLWPHVRPWRATQTEPMLRSIKDARGVSEILARAVVAAANATEVTRPSAAPVVIGTDLAAAMSAATA
jgi:Bacterial PH domain